MTYCNDRIRPKYCRLHHVILFIVLWLLMGFRHNVGVDYPVYEGMYNDPYDVNSYFVEPIWRYLNSFFRLLGFKSRIYFLVTSGFTMLAFYKGMSKMSKSFLLSSLLFILTGFYFETANTVRQCCAMGALFWGYGCDIEGNRRGSWTLYILGCFLHTTAIFGILLLLISKLHLSRAFLAVILIVSFLLGTNLMNFFINNVMPLLITGTRYSYTVDQFSDGISSGLLKYVYLLVAVMILAVSNRVTIHHRNYYRLLNLVIAGVCLYCMFYTFQPMRRLYEYGFMFITVLIPDLLDAFRYKSRVLVCGGLITVFLIFIIKSSTEPYNYNLTLF